MSKKIYAGFISVIKPVDIRLCVAVISEDGDSKYKVIFTDSYMEINGKVVDVTDYDVIDEFDELEDAMIALPILMFYADKFIKRKIKELGGEIAEDAKE